MLHQGTFMLNKTLLILCFLFMSACTTNPTIFDNNTEKPESLAVLNLLNAAQHDLNNKLYVMAESKLERALRIEPTNANVWYNLAKVAFEQGNVSEAKNIAHRALGYAPENSNVQAKIIQLLKSIEQTNT